MATINVNYIKEPACKLLLNVFVLRVAAQKRDVGVGKAELRGYAMHRVEVVVVLV